MFGQLHKSYTIALRTSQSLAQMIKLRFCTNSINLLLEHQNIYIVEVKEIASTLIMNIQTSLETALHKALKDHNEDSLRSILAEVVLPPCTLFLQHAGFCVPLVESISLHAALMLIRTTILLIDNTVISYVRSHVSDFDTAYFDSEIISLEVGDEDDEDSLLAFRCSWARLACLDTFLDGRKVWVFQQSSNKFFSLLHKLDQETRPKSVLARMKDIADLWGPVYTFPSASGFIKHYGVSKGVICRVTTKQPCVIPGAVQCHYFTRSSFFRRKASNLLSGREDLLLAEDDLVLIGGGLRVNRLCRYSISDFSQDWASETTLLGTQESFWKTDTRSLAVGLSKYLGVTVAGSQKLVPQMTRKQHTLDKWTTILRDATLAFSIGTLA